MDDINGMTPDQLRAALQVYQQQEPGAVTPPTNAKEHADQKQATAILSKPAGQLTPEEREVLRAGIDSWRKTQ